MMLRIVYLLAIHMSLEKYPLTSLARFLNGLFVDFTLVL